VTIFAPNYAPPPPALEPRSRRTLAIVEHQIRTQAGALNLVLLALIFIVVVLPLVLTVYLYSFVPGGILGSTSLATFYGPIGGGVWFILLILLVSSAGAAVVARDVSTRAMTMYLARPIRPIDYLAAKSAALGFWVFLGGVLPGWIGSLILLALGYVPLPLALEAIGGYFVVGVFSVTAFTGLAVLLSSLTPRSTLAGAGTLGTLLGSYIVVNVLAGGSGNTGFLYASPVEDLLAVGAGVFSVPGNPLDPWSAGAVLAILGAVVFGLAYWRLVRTQVIAE
jgi:ABC-type transport system involved in multi-copper enzyme maturation permease subunit